MPYEDDVRKELLPEEVFVPATDLKESGGDTQPGGGAAFTLESGEATLQYEFAYTKMRSFLRWMLGFSYLKAPDPTNPSPRRLYRENPQFHPIFPWLRATSVTFSGFSLSTTPGGTIKGNAIFASEENIKFYTKYQKVYATVRFTDKPWIWLKDGDNLLTSNSQEYNRNCFFDVSASVESLSAENGPIGQLKFSETSTAYGAGPTFVGAGPALTPPTPITNAFATLVSKDVLVLNMMYFPQEFFSSSTNPTLFRPVNVLNCIGKVNNATFMGYDPGTLLMQPPKFQRFRWPIADNKNEYGFFGYNLSIPLFHFEPPKADTATVATAKGYRTLPWAPNLKWYEAKRADGNAYLLAEADFNTIFDIPTPT